MRYAGFWRRAVAAAVDGAVLLAAAVVVKSATGGTGAPALFSLVADWLYFALLESSDLRASLGKKVVGLQVVDFDGERISFGRATARYFGKLVSAILLGIGFLLAAFTRRKQALHDLLADTLVILRPD